MRTLTAAATLALGLLSATSALATTLDFSGAIGRGNSNPVQTNSNGSFKTFTESGYTVATANANSFVPLTTGLTGNAGNFLEGGPGTNIVNTNGTVYITDGGAAFTLSSFSVYYDGTNAITFNVEGSDTSYNSPSGGTGINTSHYQCNNHGNNCTDKISTGSAGWYTITIPTTEYYTEFSIQLNLGTNAPAGAIDGLDTLVVGPAPEPGSLALLGTGMVGVAGLVRRRMRTV